MKILLVEDDESTATLISKALTAHHYLVNTTENGQTGLELTKAYNYDLILLDLMLPGLDGVSLCRKLRSQGAQMPILMVTSKNSSSDRVKGLEAGADDYVVKPFDLSELVARVRALLRRKSTSLHSVLSWGGLHLDLSSRDVTYNQVPVHLTPKEYGLLELFLRNPRRTFDRSALLDSVWDADEFPGERAVTTQIKGLRQKLKAAGMQIDCLETVYGLGYRLKPEPKMDAMDGEDSESVLQPRPAPKVAEAEVANAIESLWHKLAETFSDAFQVFDELSAPASVGTPLNPILRQQGILAAHRLAGNLGSFGLPRGSDLARQIEQTLQTKTRLSQRDVHQISTWVQALKEVVLQPRRQFAIAPSAKAELNGDLFLHRTNHNQPPPAKTMRLLLVDDDVLIAEQIQSVAPSEHFQVTVATTLFQAREYLAYGSAPESQPPRPPFDGILLDLAFAGTGENGLSFLKELTHQFPSIPVIVLTGCDRLADRVEVARLGGRAFVQKPIAPQTLLQTVSQILTQSSDTPQRVLVVDDDVQLLETFQTLLEPWGVQVITLDHAQQFWETLEASAPDLLILDLEMPQFGGLELCRAVRNDPYWGEIPILILATHPTDIDVQQVFSAGADDYVIKPIREPELVARVLNRLERERMRHARRQVQP